jgi:hypothetical protein
VMVGFLSRFGCLERGLVEIGLLEGSDSCHRWYGIGRKVEFADVQCNVGAVSGGAVSEDQ